MTATAAACSEPTSDSVSVCDHNNYDCCAHTLRGHGCTTSDLKAESIEQRADALGYFTWYLGSTPRVQVMIVQNHAKLAGIIRLITTSRRYLAGTQRVKMNRD